MYIDCVYICIDHMGECFAAPETNASHDAGHSPPLPMLRGVSTSHSRCVPHVCRTGCYASAGRKRFVIQCDSFVFRRWPVCVHSVRWSAPITGISSLVCGFCGGLAFASFVVGSRSAGVEAVIWITHGLGWAHAWQLFRCGGRCMRFERQRRIPIRRHRMARIVW